MEGLAEVANKRPRAESSDSCFMWLAQYLLFFLTVLGIEPPGSCTC
jgi:hypothetical protein